MKTKKRFGQNFLTDQSVLTSINQAIAPRHSDIFVEIGPGQGALTQGLLDSEAQVIAIELDRDLLPKLQSRFASYGNFTLYQGDALETDIAALAEKYHRKLRIVGNLPYNISTPLLELFIENIQSIVSIDIMLQREVGHRLGAEPGSKSRGRLSVMMQYWFDIDIVLEEISSASFTPSPLVTSCFVCLRPSKKYAPTKNFQLFKSLLTQAFGARRKALYNALNTLVSSEYIRQCGIDPMCRAEQLTLDEWLRLANGTQ